MGDQRNVNTALAEYARRINSPRGVDEQLDVIVHAARDYLPEIDHVGVSIAHRNGSVVTRASTDPMVLELDQLQYEFGEGPCLHAIEGDPVVIVQDARHEQRWPRFIPAAVRLGLRSQLGVRLYLDKTTRGGLNMYSVTSDTINPETEHLAEIFATQAALALGRVRSEENLNAALASRTVIGMALGILMERHNIDREAAFAYLTRTSSSRETKLREIAQELVDERLHRK
jgi:GAF domain-containing protein